MKAIVHEIYGPPEVLELKDIAKPSIGDDDVLLRVHAAGLDPSVWHLMTGLPYLVRIMGYGLRKPKTSVRGSDVAGVVEAVGKNVSQFRPGDEVFGTCRGAFAEYASARADTLLPKPANLTLEQAAPRRPTWFDRSAQTVPLITPGRTLLMAQGGMTSSSTWRATDQCHTSGASSPRAGGSCLSAEKGEPCALMPCNRLRNWPLVARDERNTHVATEEAC
jgi:hypothetical protein